jgi:hypothetical protein
MLVFKEYTWPQRYRSLLRKTKTLNYFIKCFCLKQIISNHNLKKIKNNVFFQLTSIINESDFIKYASWFLNNDKNTRQSSETSLGFFQAISNWFCTVSKWFLRTKDFRSLLKLFDPKRVSSIKERWISTQIFNLKHNRSKYKLFWQFLKNQIKCVFEFFLLSQTFKT